MVKLFLRYLLILFATLPVTGGQTFAAAIGQMVVEAPPHDLAAYVHKTDKEPLLVVNQLFLKEASSDEDLQLLLPGLDSPLAEPTSYFFQFTTSYRATTQLAVTCLAPSPGASLPLYVRYHTFRL